MNLINGEELEDVVTKLNEQGFGITRNEFKRIELVISEFPTIEAEPIRHGRWEEKIKDGKLGYGFLTERFMACSVCGGKAHYDENDGWLLPRNCPNCGAKMER